MWINKDAIADHFNMYIFSWIYNDIERCIQAKANYVVAETLLSYTEYLGALVSGYIGVHNKGSTSFRKALNYFPKQYRDLDSLLQFQYKDEKGNPQTEKGIYSIFRCGLVHEYFVKGLGKVNNNPDGHTKADRIGIEIEPISPSDPLYAVSQKRFVFRTNEYFRDFKLATEKIYQQLLTEFDADRCLAGKGPSELLTESDVKSPLLKGFCDSLRTYSSRKIV